MKLHLAVCMLALSTLAGCNGADPAPPRVNAPVAQVPAVAPLPTVPLTVDEAKVASISADELAGAEWTRQACSLDSVDGSADVPVLHRGSPHVFKGYLMDDAKAPARDFQFVLKGASNHAIPATTGYARPDVAEFFKTPELSTSGFEFSTTLESVPPGEYGVVFVIRKGQRLLFCESEKKLSVR